MQSLANRVLHWARTQPDKIAVDDGSSAYTYGQMGSKAAGVAVRLRELGVQPGDNVVIWVPKSVDAVCAILGTLIAGAVYVPVDCGSPRARLQSILRDCCAEAVIVNSDDELGISGYRKLNIQAAAEVAISEFAAPQWSPEADAYVLYTSGSTGVPNGVRISHRAMLAFFTAVNVHMGVDRESRCMNTSALYFDVSVADLLLPLHQGASVWLGPTIPLPFRYFDILTSQRITHFCAVGSTLTMLSSLPGFHQNTWDHLRCIMTGAEVLNPNTISAWLDVCPNAYVCNGYGPTETTCVCTVFKITQREISQYLSFPIGVPLPGVGIFIDCGSDTRAGVGELCISGPQVMNGYLKRESLTRSRLFEKDATLYYRTGDNVRLDDSGNLIFLGRIDDQVKVNSYRVHLGEVAEPFRKIPGIEDAIALSLNHDRFGECLAVVVKARSQSMDLADVQRSGSEALPAYMRPALIAGVPSLPMSASGKVNAKQMRLIAEQHFKSVDDSVSVINIEERAAEC